MDIIEQLTINLVDPENHGPVLRALVVVLEEQGEKAVKDQIKDWIQQIEAEDSPAEESED
jgi:hypothetical protein